MMVKEYAFHFSPLRAQMHCTLFYLQLKVGKIFQLFFRTNFRREKYFKAFSNPTLGGKNLQSF